MKTIEFESAVGPEGQIPVPPEVARELPAGQPIHIVLQWDKFQQEKPAEEDAAWRAAGRLRFEAAYAPEDAVYEQLIDATRIQ